MDNKYIGYDTNADIYVSVKEDKTGSVQRLHFHSSYEVYITHSGPMSCLINDKVYDLMPNDMLVFAPSDIHMSIKPEDARYISTVLNFNPSKLVKLSEKADILMPFTASARNFSPKISLSTKQAQGYIDKLETLKKLIKSRGELDDVRQQLALADILLFLHDAYSANVKQMPARRADGDEIVFEILKYITTNVEKDLSLDSLCEKFYLSKNILNKKFKAKTGYTIGKYIINYRMYCARQILEAGESVSDAAWKVGYNNTSNFIRTYKKVEGITPGTYKNTI